MSVTTVYPQSKNEAGPAYWQTLFNIAANYPDNPTRSDKIDTSNLIKSIISRFVCKDCIDHAFEFINQHPIKLDNKEELMRYLCSLHNNANVHEGKPEINCNDFVMNSLNRSSGCKTCSLGSFRAPSVNTKNNEPLPPAPKTTLPNIGSVTSWESRYPSFQKRALMGESITTTVTPTAVTPSISSKYPSLAGMGLEPTETLITEQKEELDGILSPLDSIYAIPANLVGIKPQEMNLAVTPELVSNLTSMVSQIYMTNFGSIFTSALGGLGLFAISLFAKNAIGHYDKLLIQNISASLLLHTLNFLNPRIREEMITDGGKMFEGVTSMNFDKVKEALLYGHHKDEKSNKELMGEIIDMNKLHKSYAGELNIKSSVPDLRMLGANQTTTAPLTRGDIEAKFHSRSQLRSPLEHAYNRRNQMRPPEPDLTMLDQMEDSYGHILDSDLF